MYQKHDTYMNILGEYMNIWIYINIVNIYIYKKQEEATEMAAKYLHNKKKMCF